MVVLAAFTFMALHLWERLTDAAQAQRWFWRWYGKGVATPVALWIILGVGAIPGLPGLIPRFPPGLGPKLSAVAGAGIIIIVSFWTGLTVAWLVYTVTRQIPEENLPRVRGLWLLWSFVLLPLAVWMGFGLGLAGAGFGLTLWLLPIAHGLVPLRTVPKKTPGYAAAIAKMKFGKWDEAEWEIIRQLEACEDDFQGWLMLAELYACHFDDLGGATRIVHDLGEQPNITPSDLAVALHKLADWQLQFADDPDAARRALREISVRYPGTLLDHMARQRMDRLPVSTEALRESRKPRLIALPRHAAAKEAASPAVPAVMEGDASAAAQACVKTLERDPNDVPARERFARLQAEQLNRPRLGIDQLELLMAMPECAPAKQAEWLLLMAQWQLRYLQDLPAGRGTLQRVLQEFRETGAAFEAQRRLCLLDVEERFRKSRAVVEVEPAPA